MCVEFRTTLWRWVSSSTFMWVLRIGLWSLDVYIKYLCSQAISPAPKDVEELENTWSGQVTFVCEKKA